MTLPERIRDKEAERAAWQKPNRTKRFKSQKHRDYVRTFACSNSKCKSGRPIEVAHVRMGTDGGLGKKPSDYFTVSLCKACHSLQHTIGEPDFCAGKNVNSIMQSFCESSPAKYEIAKHIQEVANARQSPTLF